MTDISDADQGRAVVVKWCSLAEQRLDYLTELFETGRWRRFYSETQFLENVREAKANVEHWRALSADLGDASELADTGAAEPPPAKAIMVGGPKDIRFDAAAEAAPDAAPASAAVGLAASAKPIDRIEDRYPQLSNEL